MEEYMDLPNGHLLNLQPRPRQRTGNRVRLNLEETEIPRYTGDATGFRQAADDMDTGSPKSTPERLLQKAKATKPTKLPMPRSFGDNKDQLNVKKNGTEQKQQYQGAQVQRTEARAVSYETPSKADKNREQTGRNMSAKLEQHSPGTARNKVSYQEAYKKIISLASSPSKEFAKHKLKHAGGAAREEKTPPRSTFSKIPSASPKDSAHPNQIQGPRDITTITRSPAKRRPRPKDQGISMDSSDKSPQKSSDKTDTTTDSSILSRPSISPVSGPASSITDWEDRFVAHTPAAPEPNPLNVHHISKFHQSIDDVHKDGGIMLDPDALPSPRTLSPASHYRPDPQQAHTPSRHQPKFGALDGHDSGDHEERDKETFSSPGSGRYYSPEEVGKPRCSTIWEEPPRKAKPSIPRPNPNADGSFLGCKEINGPHDRNPDEILYFSTTAERPRVVDISTSKTRPKEANNKTTDPEKKAQFEEKTVVQEEWRSISQNLKQAQCSKPSPKTLCQEPKCQPPPLQNEPPSPPKQSSDNAKQKKRHKSDDVYIITPTITRTMVTMADMREQTQKKTGIPEPPSSRAAGDIITGVGGAKPPNPAPSGLRRATQNSWDKSNASSAIPSAIPSKPIAIKNTPASRNRADQQPQHQQQQGGGGRAGIEKPPALRGYVRPHGMVKSPTENLGAAMRMSKLHQPPSSSSSKENNTPTRSVSDSPQFARPPALPLITASKKPDDKARRESKIAMQARIIEVAELDSHQLESPKVDDDDAAPRLPDLKTDLALEPRATSSRDPQSAVTLGLITDILALSAAQVQDLYDRIKASRHSKTTLLKIGLTCMLNMVVHCARVFRGLMTAFAMWNATGSWPQPSEKDLVRSATEISQATAYLLALAFIMVVVGRAAGYVVAVGSWVVWVAKPFGWVFGTVGRALLT